MGVLGAVFFIIMSQVAYGADPYIRRNLATYCPPGGIKKELKLGTQAAIFTLSAKDLAHDLSCHLELEAPGPPSSYGIHVYIQEMNFEGDEDGGCRDYVQYSRDVLAFTTYNSQKFCGRRRLIDYRHGPADAHRGYDSRHQRLYVEERDSEMDVYIVMKSNRGNIAYPDQRNLTLVATVFRKRCKREGKFGGQEYTSCPKTDRRKGDLGNCIRSEFFCDGYVNCAWPDGDLATDEAYCKAGKFVGLSGKEGYDEYGDVVSASNIPIIIIVIIVVIGISLVFFMALRHVYRGLKASPPRAGNESGQQGRTNRRRERIGPSGEETASAPPLLQRDGGRRGLHEVGQAGGGGGGGGGSGLRTMPSAPPTYEEAVKIARSTAVAENSPAPPHPPPYTEADETNI